MKMQHSPKKQRTNRKYSSAFPPSSIPPKRRAERRTLIRKNDASGGRILLSLPLSDVRLSSINPASVSVLAVALFATFIVVLSRLDCFHVHYGLGGSLSNLEALGSERGNGYVDYHFTGRGKVSYDQEARDILRANPEINLGDLDLGFVFDADQFGANPVSAGKEGASKASASLLKSTEISEGSTKGTVGKASDDALFHVTGERIRNALRKMEEQMPRPSI